MRDLERNIYAAVIATLFAGIAIGIFLEKQFHYKAFFIVCLVAFAVIALMYVVLHWDYSVNGLRSNDHDSPPSPWADLSESEAESIFFVQNTPFVTDAALKEELSDEPFAPSLWNTPKKNGRRRP